MLARDLVTAWQRMLTPRWIDYRPAIDGRAAIHRFDPIDDFQAWSRCRDRAQFHLGRGRRARDHGRYREGAREIERAIRYDDTSEAYFQVLAQCHLKASPAKPFEARWALERALAINTRNSYTIKLLHDLYKADGDAAAARSTLERARRDGAPVDGWQVGLERLRQPAGGRIQS